jgi:8-amino-7-oxononanoate synthase
MSLANFLESLSLRLHLLEQSGLRRRLQTFGARQGVLINDARRQLVDFSSNDYLGLSQHPKCVEAATRAVHDLGCGAAASRIVTGGVQPTTELEQALSEWMNGSTCLVFPTGYQANLGSISALATPRDLIFSDAHNHASLIDGCRLSGAKIVVYPHLDMSALDTLLRTHAPADGQRFIVTDSLFSMDGSLAPVKALTELCCLHEAFLIVDEAHAVGVLGPEGRGLWSVHGMTPHLLIGTMSKAAGGLGGFSSGAPVIGEWLVQHARSFVYTTFLPPPVLAANTTAIGILRSEEGDRLRSQVIEWADQLRAALGTIGIVTHGEGTPIVSISFVGNTEATRVSANLRERGLLVWAFRPPTVPEGTSLLRVSLNAKHTAAQVDVLGHSLVSLLQRIPNIRSSTKGDPDV